MLDEAETQYQGVDTLAQAVQANGLDQAVEPEVRRYRSKYSSECFSQACDNKFKELKNENARIYQSGYKVLRRENALLKAERDQLEAQRDQLEAQLQQEMAWKNYFKSELEKEQAEKNHWKSVVLSRHHFQ